MLGRDKNNAQSNRSRAVHSETAVERTGTDQQVNLAASVGPYRVGTRRDYWNDRRGRSISRRINQINGTFCDVARPVPRNYSTKSKWAVARVFGGQQDHKLPE